MSLHAWHIEGSIPAEDSQKRPYRRNLTATIICKNSDRAMELFKERFPDVKIWGLKHLGDRNNVIVDTEEV